MIWKKSEADETAAHTQSQPQSAPVVTQRSQPQPAKERALIGSSVEIKGTLSGGEDLFIEGRVEGKVEFPQHGVTVGKSGRVRADILGRSIVVMGEVDGNLFGAEQIILRQASAVRGNLFAPRVTLEDGAKFKGSIDMTPKVAAETKPPLAAGPEPRTAMPQIQRPERTVEKS